MLLPGLMSETFNKPQTLETSASTGPGVSRERQEEGNCIVCLQCSEQGLCRGPEACVTSYRKLLDWANTLKFWKLIIMKSDFIRGCLVSLSSSGCRKASVSLDVGPESHHTVSLPHSDCAFPRVNLFEEPPVLSCCALWICPTEAFCCGLLCCGIE